MNTVILSLVLVLGSLNAFAAEETKQVAAPKKLICHGPHEERELELITKGEGCVLMYKKQKENKQVAMAQNSSKPCESAMQKIRERLESGNFACE